MLVQKGQRGTLITGEGRISTLDFGRVMPGTGVDDIPPEFESIVIELVDNDEDDLPVTALIDPADEYLIADATALFRKGQPVVWSVSIPNPERSRYGHTVNERQMAMLVVLRSPTDSLA